MPKSQPPWHQEGHQWAWLLAGTGALTIGCLLTWQWHEGVKLQSEYMAATSAVDYDKSLNDKLGGDRAAFQELVDRGGSQKEQLILEIADFEKQMGLLKSKTKGLEQVKADLEKLDAEFAQYRKTEDQFKADLLQLEGNQKVQQP